MKSSDLVSCLARVCICVSLFAAFLPQLAFAASPLLEATAVVDVLPGAAQEGGPCAYHTGTGILYVAARPNLGTVIRIIDPATRLASEQIALPEDAGAILDLEVDSTNNRLCVSTNEGKFFVFGTDTNQLLGVANFAEGTNLSSIALLPAVQKAFVTDMEGGKVHVINTATVAVSSVISGLEQPLAAVANAAANRIYVGAEEDLETNPNAVVKVIDGSLAMPAVIATIPLTSTPGEYGYAIATDLAFNPVTNRIYATVVGAGNATVVVSTANNTRLGVLNLAEVYSQVEIDPRAGANNRIYLSIANDNTVRVLDGSNDLEQMAIDSLDASGTGTVGLAVNPVTGAIAASTRYNVSHFTPGNPARSGYTPLVVSLGAAALKQASGLLYVADTYGGILVVNVISKQVVAAIDVGRPPLDLAFNPNTNRLYAVTAAENLVAIDTTANAVIAFRKLELLVEHTDNGDGTFTDVYDTRHPRRLALDLPNNRVFTLHDGAVSIARGDLENHNIRGFAFFDKFSNDAQDIVYSSATSRLYVNGTDIRTINGEQQTVPVITVHSTLGTDPELSIEEPNPSPLAAITFGEMALNPVSGMLYAVASDPQTGRSQIKVIDTRNGSQTLHTVVGRINKAQDETADFNGLAINGLANRIYTQLGGSLVKIDGVTNAREGAGQPFGIAPGAALAFDAVRDQLYVTNVREPGVATGIGSTVEIFFDGPDTVPPTGTQLTPANGAQFSAALLRTGSIVVNDTRSSVTAVTYALSRPKAGGGTEWWDGAAWVTTETFLPATLANGAWTFGFPEREQGFVKGTYTLKVRATDGANNSAGIGTATFSVITPGVFSFSQAAYTAGEGAGTAVITVQRTGGTDGPVAVVYNFTDGTAHQTEAVLNAAPGRLGDYNHPSFSQGLPAQNEAARTLQFVDGEAQKTFTISIDPDDLVEGPQTVLLHLSKPTNGAELGQQRGAVLTITDDELASARYAAAGYVDLVPGVDAPPAGLPGNASFDGDLASLPALNRLYNFSTIRVDLENSVCGVNAIDLQTRTVLNSVVFPGAGRNIIADPATKRLYVLATQILAQGSQDVLYILDGAKIESDGPGAILAQFDLASGGYGQLVFDASRQRLYSYCDADGSLNCVDTSRLRLLDPVAISGGGGGVVTPALAADWTGNRLFVPAPATGYHLIDLATAQATKVETGAYVEAAVYDPVTQKLLAIVANLSFPAGSLHSLDPVTGLGQTLVPNTGVFSNPLFRLILGLDPAARRLYYQLPPGNVGDDATTQVFSLASSSAVATLPFPVSRFIPAAGGEVAVSGRSTNAVTLLDPANNYAATDIVVKATAGSVALAKAGNVRKLYVGDEQARQVVALDASTNAILARIPVGGQVLSLAFNPKANVVYATVFEEGTQPLHKVLLQAIDFSTNQVTTVQTLSERAQSVVNTIGGNGYTRFFPLVVDPATGRLYLFTIAQEDGSAPAVPPQLLEIDGDPANTSTFHTVRRTVSLTGAATAAVLHAGRSLLYSYNGLSGNESLLHGYRLSDLTEVATLDLADGQPAKGGLAVDETNGRLFVDAAVDRLTPGSMSVYDVSAGSATDGQLLGRATIAHNYTSGFATGGGAIAFDPGTKRVIVADSPGYNGILAAFNPSSFEFLTDKLGDVGPHVFNTVHVSLALDSQFQRIYAANSGYGEIHVFDNGPVDPATLPQPQNLTVQTTNPPTAGKPFTFSVTVNSSAPGLAVVFQTRLASAPSDYSSATNLAGSVTRSGNTFTLTTTGVAAGPRYFRALAQATGFAARASAESALFDVQGPAEPALKLSTVRPGAGAKPWTFVVTIPNLAATPKVQWSADGVTYTDLTTLKVTRKGNVFTVTVAAAGVPANARFFRIMASANGTPAGESNAFSLYEIDGSIADATNGVTRKTSFVGANQFAPIAQTKKLTLARGDSALLAIQSTNGSAYADTAIFSGPATADGVILHYSDEAGADITSAVVAGTHSVSLAAQASARIFAHVYVPSAMLKGQTRTAEFRVKSQADPARIDIVSTKVLIVDGKNYVFVTNSNDSGAGSLRAALAQAAVVAGTTVKFEIPANDPGWGEDDLGFGRMIKIKPSTALPNLTSRHTVIDATSQPGFTGDTAPIVSEVLLLSSAFEAQGPGVTDVQVGLTLTARDCVVRGITFHNFRYGVKISGAAAQANSVEGCFFYGNRHAGVMVDGGATNNVIGGATTAARNYFLSWVYDSLFGANFGESGITISGAGTSGNSIRGNYIGCNLDGSGRDARNDGFGRGGVIIENGASANLIGGGKPADRNVIASNLGADFVPAAGVLITGANSNSVQGNYIGISADGVVSAPNLHGVWVNGGSRGNRIGGVRAGEGNFLSSFGLGACVYVSGQASDTQILGNVMGLKSDGLSKLDLTLQGAPNSVGHGVQVGKATGVVIGGKVASARNVIAGGIDGIRIPGDYGSPGLSEVAILGNYIGTDVRGLGAASTFTGIHIGDSADDGTGTVIKVAIGDGTAAGANVIAHSQQQAISVEGHGAQSISIRGNSLHSNAGLGIDLIAGSAGSLETNPITPNDALDLDSGPNGLQNSPLILSVDGTARSASVQGGLSSTPNKTFVIDFYASSEADPSGFGEGARHLGFTTKTTNGDGDLTFKVSLPGNLLDTYITATATEVLPGKGKYGATSEFSNAEPVSN